MVLSAVLQVAVSPQEHRADHGSGRCLETCDISPRLLGYQCRGKLERLSWTLKSQRLRILFRPSVLDGTWLGLRANTADKCVLLVMPSHVARMAVEPAVEKRWPNHTELRVTRHSLSCVSSAKRSPVADVWACRGPCRHRDSSCRREFAHPAGPETSKVTNTITPRLCWTGSTSGLPSRKNTCC